MSSQKKERKMARRDRYEHKPKAKACPVCGSTMGWVRYGNRNCMDWFCEDCFITDESGG